MLSAWIHRPRKIDAPQKSCRKKFVDALNNVFQFTMPNRVDDKGIFKTWSHIAKDEGIWNFLVSKYFESFRPADKAAVKFWDSDPEHHNLLWYLLDRLFNESAQCFLCVI